MEIKKVALTSKKSNELYDNLFFERIIIDYDYLILKKADKNSVNSAYLHSTSVLMDSNLHKELNKIVGSQNFMQPGKYRKARVYLFETQYLYVAAICETGDYGSFFTYVRKENTRNKDDECLLDLQNFMRTLYLTIIKNNDEIYKEETLIEQKANIIKSLLNEEKIIKNFNVLKEKINDVPNNIKQKNKI